MKEKAYAWNTGGSDDHSCSRSNVGFKVGRSDENRTRRSWRKTTMLITDYTGY